MSHERKRVESVRERDEKKRRKKKERGQRSLKSEEERRQRERKTERERNSAREMTFMTPSHALLFTKLPLHHFIKIFLLNK